MGGFFGAVSFYSVTPSSFFRLLPFVGYLCPRLYRALVTSYDQLSAVPGPVLLICGRLLVPVVGIFWEGRLFLSYVCGLLTGFGDPYKGVRFSGTRVSVNRA